MTTKRNRSKPASARYVSKAVRVASKAAQRNKSALRKLADK